MSRVLSFFRHAEAPHPATLPDKAPPAVWHDGIHRCSVCHCELKPQDVADGCCSDTETCCYRALSGRCCW